MDQDSRNMLARALLGTGMAGQAADDLRLRPKYDSLLSDGAELPPYNVWKQLQQQMQPAQAIAPQALLGQ